MNNGQPMQVADLVQQQFPGDRSLLNAAPGQQLDLADLRPAERQIGEDFNWLMEWSPLLQPFQPPIIRVHDFISNHPCAECENDPARMRCLGEFVVVELGSLNRRWLCAEHVNGERCTDLAEYRHRVVAAVAGAQHPVAGAQQQVLPLPVPAQPQPVLPPAQPVNNAPAVDHNADTEEDDDDEDDSDGEGEEGDEEEEEEGSSSDDEDYKPPARDRHSGRGRRPRRNPDRRTRGRRNNKRGASPSLRRSARSPRASKRPRTDDKLWSRVRTAIILHQKKHLAQLALDLMARKRRNRVRMSDVLEECVQYERETFDETKAKFADMVGTSSAEEIADAILERDTIVMTGSTSGTTDAEFRVQVYNRMQTKVMNAAWFKKHGFPLKSYLDESRIRWFQRKQQDEDSEEEEDDDDDDDGEDDVHMDDTESGSEQWQF